MLIKIFQSKFRFINCKQNIYNQKILFIFTPIPNHIYWIHIPNQYLLDTDRIETANGIISTKEALGSTI